jgi:hypothetical protein
MLVTMNTSYYPFSFIPYLLPWFVIGACLALASASTSFERHGFSECDHAR